MIVEFYKLTQDSLSVIEYDIELHQLSRFVPESERANELMAHRFEEGLSTEI